ncbi:hypothetical protein KDA00_02690 [Candidatus Saccharibacteria bacterium]|nr:hypothetical protein [Candidatus Saccharibacteria bacterium]
MANLADTDLSNFELYELSQEPHWVHEVADGVISEIAEVFDVVLSSETNSDELGRLVGAVGTSKVLQENIGQVQEVLDREGSAIDIAADWVVRSGVQKALDRSLWTPSLTTPDDAMIIMTGAVANWQDRGAKLLIERVAAGHEAGFVSYPVGNRLMDSPTEITNPNVVAFHEAYGALPTESQYAEDVVAPRLVENGYDVFMHAKQMKSGDEIASEFVKSDLNYSSIANGQYVFVRVANAGIQLATQFRKAMKNSRHGFDIGPENPQVYIVTDELPIARTDEQSKDPANFQNPMTAIRQVALTAKLLQEVIESQR